MEPFEPRDAREPRAGTDLTQRLDRLRARGVTPASPPRAVLAWSLTAVLLAFSLGLIANPVFERSVRSRLPGFAPSVTPTVADLAALDTRVAALEARPARTTTAAEAVDAGSSTGQNERLARVEGTVATLGASAPAADARANKLATDLATLTGRIDAGSAATAATLTTATATAERAQAMLVLVDVRRQLAAGARLGPLELALRRSFGNRAAVEAVAALGAAPITLAALRTGLEALRPVLTGEASVRPAQRDWWQGLRETLGGVVTRPATDAGTGPAARVDRAAAALTAGNPAAAIAEIAALPVQARAAARDWLTAAARYEAGWRAVGQLDAPLLDATPPPALAASPLP